MIPTNNETYTLELYKRIENSAYEYEEHPTIIFKGRPANNAEKRNYRVLKGVESSEHSVFVFCSNLPENVQIGDRIKFQGAISTVQSIGYYYNESRLVNASIMSDEYIIKRCPKGMTLD